MYLKMNFGIAKRDFIPANFEKEYELQRSVHQLQQYMEKQRVNRTPSTCVSSNGSGH
jgi:hypothetical protein